MQDLDYAEMLEIPVSTVTVTKKKSFFKRPKAPEKTQDDLKEMVVDSVNERVGAYVAAEDLSDPPKKPVAVKSDKESRILIGEMAAVCVIALAIFLTNVFMPNTVINTFLASLTRPSTETVEPSYNQFELSSVVGAFSNTDVIMTEGGVITFTAEGSVYPVCAGKVASVSSTGGVYTVEIAHTSTFSSVITGLSTVYVKEGEEVLPNVPFAYSDGANRVNVSMYDGDKLLDCYTLAGEVPVWNS